MAFREKQIGTMLVVGAVARSV
eukprot:COSAG02_NODE_41388_length_395_cov_0.739865_1_plen_21_part_01